jgi:hypothetical protein
MGLEQPKITWEEEVKNLIGNNQESFNEYVVAALSLPKEESARRIAELQKIARENPDHLQYPNRREIEATNKKIEQMDMTLE